MDSKHTTHPIANRFDIVVTLLAVMLWGGIVHAGEPMVSNPAFLVTYGQDADIIEGDNDFIQIVFIKIPDSCSGPVFIRVFDPDCGDSLDARYSRQWNTSTRFGLYGGNGAWTNPLVRNPIPPRSAIHSATLIAEREFSRDPSVDHQWITLSRIDPQMGERIGQFYFFRLTIEGLSGDDGNRYQLIVTQSPTGTTQEPSITLLNFCPSIHLPQKGIFAEIRFFVPETTNQIEVFNFDLAGAIIGVNTVFRGDIPVSTSGQGLWNHSLVALKPFETGKMCALKFQGGEEMPNDGTFYILDEKGQCLPVHLPVFLQPPNAPPKPGISIRMVQDCQTFIFDASRSTDPDNDSLSYKWDFGDDTQAMGVRTVHRYQKPGKYDGMLIVQDDSGQINNSARRPFFVRVNFPPVADAGGDMVGSPEQTFVFDATGSMDPDGELIDYLWDFGDGSDKVRGEKVRHAFSTPGVYTVTLVVKDNSRSLCNSAQDTLNVTINAAPQAQIVASPIAAVDEVIQFDGSASLDPDGQIMHYQWDFGDGSRAEGITTSHQYDTPGKYRVTLTITDDSGTRNNTSSAYLTIHINDPPVANAGNDIKASTLDELVFDGTKSHDPDGRIVAYYWDFGDGTGTDGAKVSHRYERPGRYQARLRVKDNSGTLSEIGEDSLWVTINHPPIADAGSDIYVTGKTIQFNGQNSRDPDGNITRYFWDFGDGTTGVGQTPVHTYSTAGTYTVRLEVTDDSQTKTRTADHTITVTINYPPIADAGPDRVGVPGRPLQFNGSGCMDPDGTIEQYFWSFGDGASAEGIAVTHTYDQPGLYSVELTVRDNSNHAEAKAVDTAQVHINHEPIAYAGANQVVAPGEKVRLDASQSHDPDGKIVSYIWEVHDQTDPQNAFKRLDGPIHTLTFSKPGIYTATLMVKDDSGVENSLQTDQRIIRVNHAPVAKAGQDIFTANRTVFFDGSKSVDADGDALQFVWDFGDGSELASGMKVTHVFAQSGIWPVMVRVNDGTGVANAVSVDSIKVSINQPPIADAGGHRTVCAGKPVIFDASQSKDPENGSMKYEWDFGDGTRDTGITSIKVYKKGGIYPVTLTVIDDSGLPSGNQGTDQILVTVNESPVADAGPDQWVCTGNVVQFDGTRSSDVDGLVNQFLWDFGDGTLGGGPSPVHIYSEAGVYRVILTITGDKLSQCVNTDTDEMIVTVQDGPIARFKVPEVALVNQPVHFDASESHANVPIHSFQWDFGDNTQGEGNPISHTYLNPGHYTVSLTTITDSRFQCNQSTVQKQIIINAYPVAKASAIPSLVATHEIVLLDASASNDPDGAIVQYEWDFGDQQTGKGIRVHHRYTKPGQYRVRLKVIDNHHAAGPDSEDEIQVNVNAAPIPIINGKKVVCPGENVVLNASESTDPDGEIVAFRWYPGDGSGEKNGEMIHHMYQNPGIYTVTLETDDGQGLTNSRSYANMIIQVNASPLANAGADQWVSKGQEVVLDGSLSMDPDGTIKKFIWTFPDGTTLEGRRTSYRFSQTGIWPIQLTTMDDSETSCNLGKDIVTISVNTPPTVNVKYNVLADRSRKNVRTWERVLFDASESRDPDGDPLNFFWDFGDGVSAQGSKTIHQYEQPGNYRIQLEVNDGKGLVSSKVVKEFQINIQ